MSLAHIEELASRMRAAIEQLPREKLPADMSAFPKGSCGDASLLLGTYFNDCGVEGFKWVSGQRESRTGGTRTTHAWLARGPLIVDITADQFEDGPSRIIVSANSDWHRTFDAAQPEPSDFRVVRGFGNYPLFHLHTLYEALRPTLFQRNCGATDA